MSRRPAGPPVGQPAAAGRLQTVLAAGLAHHRRPVPTDAPTRELDSDDEMELSEQEKAKRARMLQFLDELQEQVDVSEELKTSLAELPYAILLKIFDRKSGLSCKEIARLCGLDKQFRYLCTGDLLEEFWELLCENRGYKREDRLFPNTTAEEYWTPVPAPGTTGAVPYKGSWREHYKWWCLRALNNYTLRFLVDRLLGKKNVPAALSPYDDVGHGPIASWDVSQVTDMSRLFHSAESFNADLSRWDVSNVTNMNEMFFHAYKFNADLSGWDVSNVKSMNATFHLAFNFTSDLSGWNVSNVTNAAFMFSMATRFTSDLSRWDVSNIIDMSRMFFDAERFNSDLSEWDVSGVTDMAFMFWKCESFNSDLSRWDVSNVTNMEEMFYDAISFNGDLSRWDVSNVTKMRRMFFDARSFNRDLSKWDVSNVTDMHRVFEGATSYNPPPGYGLGERVNAMEVG
jgi:surface protein